MIEDMSGRPDEKVRLLLVEDDPMYIDQILELVDLDETEIVIAKGLSSVQRHLKEAFDLVLLDFHLEDCIGLDVLQDIKAQPHLATVPIVCTSATGEPDEIESMFQAGVVDFVVKPFNGTILKGKIKTLSDLKRKSDQLNYLAHRDPLTGLFNRRQFEDRLEVEWRRCMRVQEQLSLLVIDVDHFKEINDTYGHMVGDEALIQVARLLNQWGKRAGDLLARYGGDEFVLMLPNTSSEQAHVLAEEIRIGVKEHAVHVTGDPSASLQLTVTIGLSSLMPTSTLDSWVLFERADAVLVEAKRMQMRDCVVSG